VDITNNLSGQLHFGQEIGTCGMFTKTLNICEHNACAGGTKRMELAKYPAYQARVKS
jgi:hypothetical protein